MTLMLAECQKACSETSPLSLFSTAQGHSSYKVNHCMIGKLLCHKSVARIPLFHQLQLSVKPKPPLSFVTCVKLLFSSAEEVLSLKQ